MSEHTPDPQDDQPQGNLPQKPGAAPNVTIGTKAGMWSRGSGDTSGYGGIVRQVEMPGTSTPPFGEPHDRIYQRVVALHPNTSRVLFDRGELTIYVDRQELPSLAKHLRDDAQLRFEICMSVSGVHYPQQAGAELHVVYHFLSLTHKGSRLRVEVSAPESDPHIPSIVATYPMANWHERETWDMFGVIFDGHPALTRILMPDDWAGHPQRKDYPLGGIDVEYKGARVPAPDNRRTYS